VPATFAHPALAIPLVRLGLPLSALCIGAMVPDLAYVLPFAHPWMNHSVVGIFAFSLPAGLAVWVLFQLVVKPGIYSILPAPWQAALQSYSGRPQWRHGRVWLLAALAVLLGAISHVGLDEFTHDYGFAVNTWPQYFGTPTFLAHQPLYKLLQYGLGIFGSLLCLGWVWRAYRRGPRVAWQPADRAVLLRLGVGIVGLCGLGSAYGLHHARFATGPLWIKLAVVHSVAGSLVTLGLGSILLGLAGVIQGRNLGR
jgi:hypothetical protein